MTALHTAATAKQPRPESRITSGKTLLVFGDSRSAGARRLRDLVKALSSEASPVGFAQLPPSAQQVIRRVAQLSVELEILETQRANGLAIDQTGYLALANCHRRALGDFERLKQRTGPRAPATKPPSKRAPTKRRDALTAFSFGGNP